MCLVKKKSQFENLKLLAKLRTANLVTFLVRICERLLNCSIVESIIDTNFDSGLPTLFDSTNSTSYLQEHQVFSFCHYRFGRLKPDSDYESDIIFYSRNPGPFREFQTPRL